jgi:uncharacterized oxidoreductase
MKTKNNTILITGGATGIGLALAEAFVKEGNQVIICGRRKERLEQARKKLSGIAVQVCDVAEAEQRQALLDWSLANFPHLNMLVNNAGVQRSIDFTQGMRDLSPNKDEIEINFNAPVQLSALFLPHLIQQQEAAIVNVSSGLGFIPLTILPVYCATKAALHSFSLSLRHQLRRTRVKVFELIPPTVDTELDGGARDDRPQEYRGIPAGEVAQAALIGLGKDEFEITVGQSQGLRTNTRQEAEQIFQRMNGNW